MWNTDRTVFVPAFLDLPPRAVVVHRDPPLLLGPVVPVLVVLVVDLDAHALDDVENLVVVIVPLVVIGDRLLAHLGVQTVEVEEHLVELRVEVPDVEAEPGGFVLHDGIIVRGIGGVELDADALRLLEVLHVIAENLGAELHRERARPVDGADDERVDVGKE
jgi:hypothetical protein